jgi:Beta-L-arabinofuranosidase, GH127/F5/8 type C domain
VKPLLSTLLLTSMATLHASANPITGVNRPDTTGTNAFYVSNRAPLAPSPFIKLPVGAITPKGWLRHQLEFEANGMEGRLPEVSRWLKLDGNGWIDPKAKGGWEELPYWLKGFGDLGYVLRDEKIIAAARQWLDGIIGTQQPDGWFGPQGLRAALNGQPDMWPHMPVLNALQSFYEFSSDERVLKLMTAYFKWQNTLPPAAFSAGWAKVRFGDNLESVYWLYNRTGEAWLLDLAKKIHENMARWDTGIISWHNVNIAEGFREPTEYWMQAKDEPLRTGAERNYQEVMGRYGQFPGGGFAGDENCRPGYSDPRQGFETCGWVEFMHSFEMLTRITGDPVWVDRCEEIAFNSLPAALTPDAKALHYLTGANMVQLDKKNKSPGVQNGGTMLSYSPAIYRCCQHNQGMGWPYYAEELWLATPDNGLCASLYAASEVSAKVGDGATVKITEETDYPFNETIKLTIATPKTVAFPLYLRMPRWSSKITVVINGQPQPAAAGNFIRINRTWSNGDTVMLQLPMQVTTRRWEKNKNAVSVDYGPLTFSLKIGEKRQRYGGTDAWPESEVFPTTPWNYGLVLDGSFELVRNSSPLPEQPFTPDTAPLQIKAHARKIPGWTQDRNGLLNVLHPSPVKSTEPVESVTLIPMGAARLRITAFPVMGEGADAHEWIGSPEPPFKASASHCFDGATVEALWACDGIEPANSSDHNIPRFTWWPRKGTAEWVQYDSKSPRSVSALEVYWYDDTGKGQCRVPQSWKLLYKDSETWKPVAGVTEFGIQRDTFNRVTFPPVTASALRLEVQLQPNVSGGILEWRVK